MRMPLDEALPRLRRNDPTLTELHLGGSEIGDAEASALARALQWNSKLQGLSLKKNQIGDVGAIALAEALNSNRSLQGLSLKENNIGDVGASAMAEILKRNYTLQRLDLSDNSITDTGKQALTAALGLAEPPTDLEIERTSEQLAVIKSKARAALAAAQSAAAKASQNLAPAFPVVPSTRNLPSPPPSIAASTAASIFISLRFGEASAHGAKLEAGLKAAGHSVFLCNVPPGADIAATVIAALSKCELVVILGTGTYGRKTKSGFSTFEELRYTINEEKPFFLVKMCGRFSEEETRFRLPPDISYFPWQPRSPSEPLPKGLVPKISERLADVRAATGTLTTGNAARTETGTTVAVTLAPPPITTPAHATRLTDEQELAAWLNDMRLGELASVLQRLEVFSVPDAQHAVKRGLITLEDLVAQGVGKIQSSRFLEEAGL